MCVCMCVCVCVSIEAYTLFLSSSFFYFLFFKKESIMARLEMSSTVSSAQFSHKQLENMCSHKKVTIGNRFYAKKFPLGMNL